MTKAKCQLIAQYLKVRRGGVLCISGSNGEARECLKTAARFAFLYHGLHTPSLQLKPAAQDAVLLAR